MTSGLLHRQVGVILTFHIFNGGLPWVGACYNKKRFVKNVSQIAQNDIPGLVSYISIFFVFRSHALKFHTSNRQWLIGKRSPICNQSSSKGDICMLGITILINISVRKYFPTGALQSVLRPVSTLPQNSICFAQKWKIFYLNRGEFFSAPLACTRNENLLIQWQSSKVGRQGTIIATNFDW